MITTLNKKPNTYNMNYDVITSVKEIDLNNKLFCTFTTLENLDGLLEDIQSKYTIIYNKVFVLEIADTNEYVVTYNVEQGNVHSIPEHTILVHRKKESNTLYTINALNELIKKLNDGLYDAIILSYAGIKLLSIEDKITEVFSTQEIIQAMDNILAS